MTRYTSPPRQVRFEADPEADERAAEALWAQFEVAYPSLVAVLASSSTDFLLLPFLRPRLPPPTISTLLLLDAYAHLIVVKEHEAALLSLSLGLDEELRRVEEAVEDGIGEVRAELERERWRERRRFIGLA
ncbi:hypothetical protein JCM10207_005088 [Rhodosporidiobolus poonsookiae]